MGTRVNQHQGMLYRSVPPRPHSYTFPDDVNCLLQSSRSKTAPSQITPSDEHSQKFNSRQTARPKVIDFDGGNVKNTEVQHLNKNGFYPPVKLKLIRMSDDRNIQPQEPGIQLSRLKLAPMSKKSLKGGRNKHRSASNSSSIKTEIERNSLYNLHPLPTLNTPEYDSARIKSNNSMSTPNQYEKEKSRLFDSIDSKDYSNIMSNNDEFEEDLSNFPPPAPPQILPSRELPWVYRFKVKRGMNAVSKIMASKPPRPFFDSW
ncbi:hypothetical protein SNE40_005768 [Patella caerulea]|uniref:Uncharacterized protein n=1 Tax=Patella caerulea TaxID=87958 RepID=A0AAN8K2B2_PATCE